MEDKAILDISDLRCTGTDDTGDAMLDGILGPGGAHYGIRHVRYNYRNYHNGRVAAGRKGTIDTATTTPTYLITVARS